MENFTFVEFEILSAEHDENGNLVGCSVYAHYAFMQPAHDYHFTRVELINRLQHHDKFYQLINGEKQSVICTGTTLSLDKPND